MSNDNSSELLTLPIGRLSYCNLIEPRPKKAGEEKKKDVYDCSYLIPKDADQVNHPTCMPMFKALSSKFRLKFPEAKFNSIDQYLGLYFKGYKVGVRDGDKDPMYEDKAECHNHWVVGLRSYGERPGLGYVVGGKVVQTVDPKVIYSGCYGIARVKVYAFVNESKGVSISLQHILKTSDGEPLAAQLEDIEQAYEGVDLTAFEHTDNAQLFGTSSSVIGQL